MITITEAAAKIGCSRTTIYAALKRLDLKAHKHKRNSLLDDQQIAEIKSAIYQPVKPQKPQDVMAIYFFFNEVEQLVKIGYTEQRLKDRVSQLRTAAPNCRPLGNPIPGGLETERQLHERFTKYRVSREWFRYTGELKKYIAEVLNQARDSEPEWLKAIIENHHKAVNHGNPEMSTFNMVDALNRHRESDLLTKWEQNFVADVYDRYFAPFASDDNDLLRPRSGPSPKQLDILWKIYMERLNVTITSGKVQSAQKRGDTSDLLQAG